MRKKFIAGAAVLALLMNSPQVKAEDEIVIFGGEFDDESTQADKKKIEESEPVKEPPEEEPVEKSEPPELVEPEIPTQPLKSEEPAQVEPQENLVAQPEDDESFGDTLIFDDLNDTPLQEPLEEPIELPQEIQEPIVAPLSTLEYEQPFAPEPILIVPPSVPNETINEEIEVEMPRQAQPQPELKMLKPRFVKLAVDDTYTYYLDKEAVEWKKMPYSSSEYIADVWVRMIERKATPLEEDMAVYGEENFKAQIELAREQGYQYPPEDIKVLSQQGYILEHYYLRPKTKQVQFLCELEVFGRPQNTINERVYDYKNWENLVPGSVESTIYEAAIKVLGKSKASERGHMTFIDMLEEYGRISLR